MRGFHTFCSDFKHLQGPPCQAFLTATQVPLCQLVSPWDCILLLDFHPFPLTLGGGHLAAPLLFPSKNFCGLLLWADSLDTHSIHHLFTSLVVTFTIMACFSRLPPSLKHLYIVLHAFCADHCIQQLCARLKCFMYMSGQFFVTVWNQLAGQLHQGYACRLV